eukprot:m.242940 g.242940  ORF g.242940 m.242940 type:complete len:319 (-) comp39211_c0_seq1:215-1171(-)
MLDYLLPEGFSSSVMENISTVWPSFVGIPMSDFQTVESQTPAWGDVVLEDVLSLDRWALSLCVAAMLSIILLVFRIGFSFAIPKQASMVAFEVTAGLCVIYMSAIGNEGFYLRKKMVDPVHGFDPLAYHINQIMLGYQIYNTIFLFLIPGLFEWNVLLHHLFTGALAFVSLFHFAQGYAFFFFGVIETSTIFLILFHAVEYADMKQTILYVISGAFFSLSFYIYRVFLWVYPTYQFWQHMLNEVFIHPTHKENAMTIIAAVLFLAASATLTIMQAYWAKLVFKNVTNALQGKPTSGSYTDNEDSDSNNSNSTASKKEK